MIHEPADDASRRLEDPAATRLGLRFFWLYTAVYAAFVAVSAFRPDWMATTLGGVNLAVLSGFGLILGAILLAVIYLWMMRAR
jgi:uncharacterized membrane protein (DUF485 family)